VLLYLIALLAGGQAETAGCPLTGTAKDVAWHARCDAAIAAEKDSKTKSLLLFRSAYAFNEQDRSLDARPLLDEAVKLDPANAPAWQELSYTANALGDYADGERAAEMKMALGKPDAPDKAALQERAFSRFYRGNLIGAFEDRNTVLTLSGRDPGVLIAHASTAMWAGRNDLARVDLESAGLVAADQQARDAVAVEVRRLASWSTGSGAKDPAKACLAAEAKGFKGKNFIGDCSAAFLAEKNPAKRAHYLTIRSMGWQLAGDQDASTTDRAIAVALDPGDPGWHSNLGFSYLGASHSWGARREFDRALAAKPDMWVALAGRAAAKYNLKDLEGAFADAKRAFEIKPNELALTVLGDLAHDRGDDASARLYWMGAWHLGGRDDGLTARLKEIGIEQPDKEPAGAPITLR
jgi:tetratricopeptide (TPR) repeat protein